MMLRAGVSDYPLPSTWRGQPVILKSGRDVDYPIVRVSRETFVSFVTNPPMRGLPGYHSVDHDMRVISFYPVPDTDYEVEFVEE